MAESPLGCQEVTTISCLQLPRCSIWS